ncbi:hypothetical protein KGA66_09025 [Actinocrinis puniceicyclus]|uniref:TfoX N-terminal domain-containing protein n=1 Tax=Actinocrinis puniceicyclus TaxID=977794 RepID=A0A8J8BCJ5_9ACTN|nr:hypothetical protein [Actinocrinis puniceicyclus]MBS2963186.1 hypothetical protein [Actinocrinis puniceicyclus]
MSDLSPHERFDRLVGELLERPGISYGGDEPGAANRFGANALKTGGKIFAMLVRGSLVLKLPRGRVDALVDAGEGTRFDPRGGRPMTEWLVLDPGSTLDWSPLADEAMQYVGAVNAKAAGAKARMNAAGARAAAAAPVSRGARAPRR